MSRASDEKIIQNFLGDYVAGGDFSSPSPDKDPWFPRNGVKLKLSKVDLPEDQVGVKILVDVPDNLPFQGKAAIEAATYRVIGEKLIAENLPVFGSVTAVEVLEMDAKGDMLHTVYFSDKAGRWTCPKPKP